ncbi:hypothetical protein LZ32DRAFT_545625 [Colletotrichum eremochloae]|nr:hypothetical protein LZ32DRAFT_545625 [Colletotrichum eremochloae]
MTDIDWHNYSAFATEVGIELRDLPLRAAIDDMIRHFFECFDRADWDGMREHLSLDGAKLIDSEDDPATMHTYTNSVVDFFEGYHTHYDQITAHHLLLVDRGRVTCHVSHFALMDGSQFSEERTVYIIDLDGEANIKRIELRAQKNKKVLSHDGGLRAMRAAAAKAEKNAVKMDHSV